MRRIALLALPAFTILLTAASGDMSVATFLSKADALKAKGVLAMGSPDIDLLKTEVQGASKAYRARIDADKKAKKVAHSCPPAKAAMNSNDLLTHLRTYPAAHRQHVTVRAAFFDLMKKRYPCK